MDFSKYLNDTSIYQIEKYIQEQNELDVVFQKDVLQDLGIEAHPQAKKLFEIAWNVVDAQAGNDFGDDSRMGILRDVHGLASQLKEIISPLPQLEKEVSVGILDGKATELAGKEKKVNVRANMQPG